MGLDTVVFAQGLVKVQHLAVDSDVHAAVIKGGHWRGIQGDIS